MQIKRRGSLLDDRDATNQIFREYPDNILSKKNISYANDFENKMLCPRKNGAAILHTLENKLSRTG